MSATNNVPEKQVAHHDDLPIMSAPPDYASAAQDGGGPNQAAKITPLRELRAKPGPEPEWVECPFCKETSTVRRVSEPSDEAKCLSICCCGLGIVWFFVFGLLLNVDIHCASCDKHLVTIAPDDEVQIVRVPNQRVPPSMSTTSPR
ncbi:hypothetical protein SAMD00023353_0701710 [Rosellinia necatrix]|uniref:LITAF domain-containing protein n=1 Tax=Rosellinia necatrix TaxID=77044 RepID=A0A1S7ULY5_ROSNE|nr:hypothetical protein SAMD00023353_0701710 [Rosellinia necatrix]